MKINWIAFLVVLIFVYIGCKEKPDDPVVIPVVIPDPVLTLSVSDDTVSSGDIVTISVVAVNAVKTESNVTGAPKTTQWSYDIIVTENFEILVSAYNIVGNKIQKSQKITIVVPYVPNKTDTISSMAWYKKAVETFNKDNILLSHLILTESDTTDVYRYYKDWRVTVTPKGGKESSPNYWGWDGPHGIIMGDQHYTYDLNYDTLYLYQTNRDGSEIYRDTFVGVKL